MFGVSVCDVCVVCIHMTNSVTLYEAIADI